MHDKPRCQSCGMPFEVEGFYGTNANGTELRDYCKFCYQAGAFTQPDLTLEGMIAASVHFTTKNLGFAPDKAEEMSRAVIPGLKRWTQS